MAQLLFHRMPARIGLATLVLAVWSQPGQAQQAELYDAPSRRAAIDSVCSALNSVYVFPDTAATMEALVRQRLAAGAYNRLDTRAAFTAALTRDLQSVSRDRHLRVYPVNPAVFDDVTEPDSVAERRELAALASENFRFHTVKRLTGNIGYLRFDSFVDATYAGPTAVAAMNFLAHSDALIIDLRYNGGGHPSMVQLLSSYLFDEPTHTMSWYDRRTDSMRQFWTLAHVAGPRMARTPVYLLVSNQTFSAAEDFAYSLKHLDRATVIGETTGGGAHPVDTRTFAGVEIGISIPFGRAIHPVTGGNWERTGVVPDIVAPAERALALAHLEALEHLKTQTIDETRIEELSWHVEGVASGLEPVELRATVMAGYVGHYGPRTIELADGRLYYRRDNGPRELMIPMNPTLFRFERYDTFRIEVVTDQAGNAVKLIGHFISGRQDESPRTR